MINDDALIENLRAAFRYENGSLYLRSSRGPRSAGARAGSNARAGYRKLRFMGSTYQEHRVIFAMHHGYFPDQVDHVDGDRANNSVENLRAATNETNGWNTGLRSTNKSGIKGVYWHKGIRRWVAMCRANGRQNNLGSFNDIADAAKVLHEFRQLHHGEFAKSAEATIRNEGSTNV